MSHHNGAAPQHTALPNEPPALKKLRWQCRRGMREMDMLLERWLDRHYQQAAAETQASFTALLGTEDDLLWDWLMGKAVPEHAATAALITHIRESFAAVAH
jgi:antitoxin CptB